MMDSVIINAFFEGFGLSFLIFAITLIFALPLGLLLSFCSMSRFKIIKLPTRAFIWIIRGTPLLLQLVAITFIPTVFGIMNKDVASFFGLTMANLNVLFVLVAFVINYTAYFSEIYRGGIESIPQGQYEAGQVLGLTKKQIFGKIVLLQVVKRIMPAMTNEFLTLIKDTALARTLGVGELLFVAYTYTNELVSLTPLLFAGLFYLVFGGIMTLVFAKIEKKLSYFKC